MQHSTFKKFSFRFFPALVFLSMGLGLQACAAVSEESAQVSPAKAPSTAPLVLAQNNAELDCQNAITTVDLNRCAQIELSAAEQQMEFYLEKALILQKRDPVVVEGIKIAQQQWLAYQQAHCESVYNQWREGTIRGVMAVNCKKELTQQRTFEIWKSFLTTLDSSLVPRPEF
ncbi:lysozyme inhibitor LprI family protein [Sessilibacter sp. MAH4]